MPQKARRERLRIVTASAVTALAAIGATAWSTTASNAEPNPAVISRIWSTTNQYLDAADAQRKREEAALREALSRAARTEDLLAEAPDELAASKRLTQAALSAQSALRTPALSPGTRLAALENLNSAISEAQQGAFLQEKIADQVSQIAPQAEVAIYVRDLSAKSTIVEINADRVFPAASTYKIFVAESMIRAVEDKQWKWKDPLLGSLTLAECFDEMIVESDNACPEAWLQLVGPESVQKDVQRLGLGSTKIAWGGMATTARDLGVGIEGLLAGNTLTRSGIERLESAMSRQEFREGIPAGIPSAEVADKVGFLDEYLHDAGLVHSPKGDYVVVILTAGAAWEQIAEIAAALYAAV